jgi:hypothetical protein
MAICRLANHRYDQQLQLPLDRALRSLKANDLLTVLPSDKGNAAVLLGTSDYNKKIANFLQDKTYAKLKKDPTDAIERKTVLLKSPHFPRRCASTYDHRVPAHLGFMACGRFTNLVCH